MNERLRIARLQRGWSQQELADRLGIAVVTVNRWERGGQQPRAYYRLQLCTLFEKSAYELGLSRRKQDKQDKQEHTQSIPEKTQTSSLPPVLSLPISQADTRALIGREALVAQLVEQLCSGINAHVLVGLPGIGKTALAAALAYHPKVQQFFNDGILWVGLGKQPNVLELMNRWGRSLGFTTALLENLTSLDAWTKALHDHLEQRRMLLIIDDAWDITEASLFRLGGPLCVHLLTTRFPAIAYPFGAGQATQVQELPAEESRRLLEYLAPQMLHYGTEGDLQELTASVGGLPLALTLMGRYLSVQTASKQPRRIQTALHRLRENVEARLLLAEPVMSWTNTSSFPIGATLSLRTTIEMSDQSLHETARSALRALSIFSPKPYSFSEEAALAVCASETDILDMLFDHGLVESHQPGRYTLHQTIADYAAQYRVDATEVRFATFFLAFIHKHQDDWDTLEEDLHNITAAFDQAFKRGMEVEFLHGVLAFAAFLEARRMYALASSLLQRAQHIAFARHDDEGSARIWLHLGRMAELRCDLAQAEQWYREGLTIARTLHQPPLLTRLLFLVGSVSGDQGKFADGEIFLRESLALLQGNDDRKQRCDVLRNLAEVIDSLGCLQEALVYYEQALVLAREIGYHEEAGALLQDLGVKASLRGDYRQATAYFQESLALAREIKDQQRQCALLMNMGMVAFEQQQYEEALDLSLQSLTIARSIDSRFRISSVLQNLGIITRQQGHEEQTERYLRESLALAEDIGHHWLICEGQYELAKLFLQLQNWPKASHWFHTSLKEAREMGAQQLIARNLFGIAQIEAHDGNLKEAFARAQESLSIFEALDQAEGQQVAQWLAQI